MSEPPPPSGPLLSPDGRYYWDGSHWVPLPGPSVGPPRPARPGNTSAIAVTAVVIGVLLVGSLIWYFGFYDTAAGKCNRGDLGACVVVAGQQAAQAAAVASASAEAQASADAAARAAAAQQQADETNKLEAAMSTGCTVVLDPNHNMRVTFIGPDSASGCATAMGRGWTAASRVAGASIVCSDGSSLVVEDTGGWILGRDECQQLNLTVWPNTG